MKLNKIVWLLVCCFLINDPSEAADGQLDTSFNAPDGYVLWDGGSGYDRGRDVALHEFGSVARVGQICGHQAGLEADPM